MNNNKLYMIFAVTALLFGLTFTAFPQGKGQPKKGQTVTKGTQDRDKDRDQDRDQDRDRDQDKDQDQDQDRIRATDQQRDQLRIDLGEMDKLRRQLRDMVRESGNGVFTSAQGKQQQEQLRERFRNMEQEHERFMLGLNDDQKNRFREDARIMEQQRERVNNRLQLMEQEMNQGQFDRLRHRTHIREIEKAIKKWQSQFRNMEKHMLND